MKAVRLSRTDAGRKMARFYSMTVQPTLFGQFVLVREWGRLGQAGRVREDVFHNPDAATHALQRLHAAKARRGYR